MPAFRPDPIRDGYVLAAGVWCVAIALGLIPGATDAVGWYQHRLPNPYDWTVYSSGYGFFFAPPIAFALFPLTLLPWPLFAAVWTGVMFAALGFLLGRWAFVGLLFPPVWWEIHAANVNLLIAAAAVAGLRWQAAWSIVLFTKVTPGVALVWYVVRRDWRGLFVVLGTTAVIGAMVFLAAPALWAGWLHALITNVGDAAPGYFIVPVMLPVRVFAAAALVAWGGLTSRAWTVPVAAVLAMPVLWYNALAGLVGIVRARDPAFGGPPRRFTT